MRTHSTASANTEVAGSPRPRRRRDRGAAMVEFALVMPLLVLLIFGAIDFGFMINRSTLVNNAARDGARVGSLNPDKTAIEAAVRSELSSLKPADLTVTVTCRKPDNTACGVSTFDADATSGGVIVVKVDYKYTWLSFAAPAVGLGKTKNVTQTIEMRIE